LAFLSGLTLALDFATKSWARKRLVGLFGAVNVWPGNLTLVLKKNHVDSWGLLENVDADVNRAVLIIVALVAIAIVLAIHRRIRTKQEGLPWGPALVLGGALGNLLDRARFGYVIDFIDVHMLWGGMQFHAPTVNVADIAIGIGVGLLAIPGLARGRAP
jgi:signal peptidase II